MRDIESNDKVFQKKMKQIIQWITGLIFLAAVSASVAQAQTEQRVALVIGNGAYPDAPLRNPPNDAQAMAHKLRVCGFEVIEKINSDQRGMEEAIREFGMQIQRGGVGLFYYAGHGMQVQGTNYLIPVGTEVKAEDEVKFKSVDAGMVLSKMESAGNRMNIMILDACRNNPFDRSFRSADRGLKKMDAPTGTLLAYATAPGNIAADGTGENGLYTAMLLKHLDTPGLAVEQVFKRVRDDVMKATGDSQVPWESTSLRGDFFFVPGESMPSPSPAPIMPPPPAAVAYGHLQVNVNAPNSQVYVVGTYRGTASPGQPLNLQNLGTDTIQVRVTAGGYKESTQQHTLKANEWTQAVFELAPVEVTLPAPVQSSPRPEARPQPPSQQVGQTRTFSLPGGASIEMVWIEPGTFLMGSPSSEEGRDSDEAQHKVTINQGFYLGKYEITQAQWEAVMGFNLSALEGANHPVEQVSWEDVEVFISELNLSAGSEVYRLPTEAEWEYACRAGTSARWSFGEDESQLGEYAWYRGNNSPEGTKAVGQKKSNPWGLYDMYGNVWEWCQDWKGRYSFSRLADPTGPVTDSYRVVRGGAFSFYAQFARSAYRSGRPPSARHYDLGMRLLRTP